MQQNNEFERFDKNRRNLLLSCSIEILFLSNDRAEFQLSFDINSIDLQSPRSLENIPKFT